MPRPRISRPCLTPRRAQDFQNLKAEWSNSALDHRQRATFTPIYDFMPFKDKNWLDEEHCRELEHLRDLDYETPEYATVQSGIDSNRNGDTRIGSSLMWLAMELWHWGYALRCKWDMFPVAVESRSRHRGLRRQ